MADPIRNFFKSTLVGTYSDTDTSFTIATGDGALLPDPATDGAFNLTIFRGLQVNANTTFEIVRVTARSGDVLTVTREQEGTTALTVDSEVHSILMSATKKTFDDLQTAIDSIEGGATAQERVAIMDLMMRQAEDDFDNSRTEIDFYGGFYDVFVNEDKIVTSLDNIVSITKVSTDTYFGGRDLTFSIAGGGTKVYVTRASSNLGVYEYTLSTPYDFTTATFVQFAQLANPVFGGTNNGNYMWFTISENGEHGVAMNQYRNKRRSFDLSTAYDITTVTNVNSQDSDTIFGGADPLGITISDDGNYLYSHTSGTLRRHPMSTAYNISTAGSADKTLSIDAEGEIKISNDGTLLMARKDRGVNIYKFTTAFDPSTGSFVSGDTEIASTQSPYDVLSVDVNDNLNEFIVLADRDDEFVTVETVLDYNLNTTVSTVDNLTVSAGVGGTVSHISGAPGTFQATPIDLSDAITGSPSAVVMTADGTDVEGNFSISLSDGTNTVVVSTLDTEVDVSALTSTTLTPTVEISNGASIKSYALYFK